MKLLSNISFKANVFIRNQCRCFCNVKTSEEPVKKYVYISQSTDVHTNLALEDWIYTHTDFTNQEILMLWRNKPCVVIGRHQNPWLEANVEKLERITPEGVKLARRNSGGGTVYQDEGNLNITFFMTKENYNRKHNLQIISRALFREYNLKLDISEREDLVVRDHKVSGTAAKIARVNAYHHCTLLINANKDHLKQALHKTDDKIETRATQSIRSPILNLKEENPKVSIDNAMKAIGLEFLHSPHSFPPKRKHLKKSVVADNGFHLVNPTEVWFPGIQKLEQNLLSWEWIFGKCPEFTITREVKILDPAHQFRTFDMKVLIKSGRINKVELIDQDVTVNKITGVEEKLLNRFENQRYSRFILDEICLTATKVISDIYTSHKDQAMNTKI